MKINDIKVKGVLELLVVELQQARKDTYTDTAIARQGINGVIGSLDTLVKIIEFEEGDK